MGKLQMRSTARNAFFMGVIFFIIYVSVDIFL